MNSDPHDESARDDAAVGMPRWVKTFAVIGIVVLALLVLMLLSGHEGPGRHF